MPKSFSSVIYILWIYVSFFDLTLLTQAYCLCQHLLYDVMGMGLQKNGCSSIINYDAWFYWKFFFEFCQIADELTQTQGKVEATKDTVRELNEKLEPVEVGLSWCYLVCWVFTLQETFLLFNSCIQNKIHVTCQPCHEQDNKGGSTEKNKLVKWKGKLIFGLTVLTS